ncbi:MAG: substrate-binding domain-containing protein [Candidatus Hydrogenedentes bacterium]|nr:substrate-binding domain-containing protein [Candidatus Hydrogenedentota bacterium]
MPSCRLSAACFLLVAATWLSSCGAPKMEEPTAPPAADSADSPAEAPLAAPEAPVSIERVEPVNTDATPPSAAPLTVNTPKVALLLGETTPTRAAMAEALATAMQAEGIAFEQATLDLIAGGGAGKLREIAASGVTSIILMADAIAPDALSLLPATAQRIALVDPLPGLDRVRYVGPAHVEAGKAAGTLVQGCIPPMLRIVVYCRRHKAPATAQRLEGLREQLSRTGNDIYEIVEDGGDPSRLIALVTEMAKKRPEVACLVALEAYQTEALVEGLDAAGRLGGVRLVCTGLSPSTLEGIRRGYINGSVDDMGTGITAAVVAAVRAPGGEEVTIAPALKLSDAPAALPVLPQ